MIDLDTGRILWVAKGRGKDALRKFWRRLRLARARVEAVACDMSAAYWSAILENLPGAAIVFDHFHIIKLANEKIDELRRALQREAGILERRSIKGTRYLLLMGAENVPEHRREALEAALKFNEPLSFAYYMKEELRLLWSQGSLAAMRRYLEAWCAQAMESGIVQMVSLARTLRLSEIQISALDNYKWTEVKPGTDLVESFTPSFSRCNAATFSSRCLGRT